MINCLPPRSEVIILKFHVKKSLFRSFELTKYSYPPPAANFLRVAARLVICVAAFTFRNRKGQPREVRVKQLPEIHWTTANLPNSSVCPFHRNLLILFGIILLSSHVAHDWIVTVNLSNCIDSLIERNRQERSKFFSRR